MKTKFLFLLIIAVGVAVFFGLLQFSFLRKPPLNVPQTVLNENENPDPVSEPPIPTPPQPPQVAGDKKTQPASPPEIVFQEICTGQDQVFDCYEKYYRELLQEKGIVSAFADIKDRYNKNAYVKAQCHPLTHVVGQAATQIYPKVSEAYLAGDSFCWSGYYHGVMEGIVAKWGRAEFPRLMNEICAGLPGKAQYSFDYFNCVHGLGHGVMVYTINELFEALSTCDSLEGSWEQSSCYGGVYMENVIIDNKNHFTKYLNPQDPIYPCNAVADKYKNDCFTMQTSYMLKVTGGDFKKVFSLCASAEEAYRPTCYQSLGRDASGRSSSSVSKTAASCALGANFEQRSNCIIGAVKDFISYFHSDVQAKELCAALDGELQPGCYSTAESYYRVF